MEPSADVRPLTVLKVVTLWSLCTCYVNVRLLNANELRTLTTNYSQELRADHREILRDFWTWRLKHVPEFASALGVHTYDGRLESFTLEAYRRRKEECEVFLRNTNFVDTNRMTSDDVTSVIILRHDLRTYIDGYRWLFHSSLNPINSFEGIHRDFTYWIDSMKFDSEENFRIYINRLRALATQIHEQINLMKEAMRFGLTSHRLSMQSVVDAISATIDSNQAEFTPFFKPFNDSLEFVHISANKADLLRSDGISVIQDHVIDAYKKLTHFIKHDYMRKARPVEGVSSLPGGSEYYEACLKWYLSPPGDVTVASLHQLARQTVDSLLSKIEDIRRRVNFSGKLEEFLKHANGANKLFYRTEDELLEGYREIVESHIPAQMNRLFYPFAKTINIQVQPMPFDGPTAVLLPGPDDNSSPSIFFVNVKEPLKRPKWQMRVIALHETVPGRFLQTVYAQNQSLPHFRKWREYRKMFSVPFQFPFNTAYTEGWALYAEWLGYELDLYNNPYDQFGQLHSQLYKACEMVVDTGLHALGWTTAESVHYLIRMTGVSRTRAESDVQRIVTFPAQAVVPQYGYLRLRSLRQAAEAELKERFDIREFHHQILRLGPVPLNILEKKLQNWFSPGVVARNSAGNVIFQYLGTVVLHCCVTVLTLHISSASKALTVPVL